jgi:hypothetical protein
MNMEIPRHGFCAKYGHLGKKKNPQKMQNKGVMGEYSNGFYDNFQNS